MRLASKLVSVGAVLLFPLALSAADGISLKPRFAPGDTVRYEMQLAVTTKSVLKAAAVGEGEGRPVRLDILMTWRVETLAVEPDGDVRFRAVIERLEMGGAERPASAPVEDFIGKPISYRLRSDGHIDEIVAPPDWLENGQSPAWLQTWLEQGTGLPGGLPDHPLTPGDTWRAERDIQVPGLPSQHLISDSQYVQDEEANRRPCASVTTQFELRGADTTKPEDTAGVVVERRVNGNGTRLSCFDLETGRLLRSSQKSDEAIHLGIGDPTRKGETPTVVESTTTTESELRLLE